MMNRIYKIARHSPFYGRLARARSFSVSGRLSPVIQSFECIKTLKDIEDCRIAYSESRLPHYAVVKIGGEVAMKQMDELVSAVKFLRGCGMIPLVVHGGGPQLNDRLKEAGVEPTYEGGKEPIRAYVRARRIIFCNILF